MHFDNRDMYSPEEAGSIGSGAVHRVNMLPNGYDRKPLNGEYKQQRVGYPRPEELSPGATSINRYCVCVAGDVHLVSCSQIASVFVGSASEIVLEMLV